MEDTNNARKDYGGRSSVEGESRMGMPRDAAASARSSFESQPPGDRLPPPRPPISRPPPLAPHLRRQSKSSQEGEKCTCTFTSLHPILSGGSRVC
jgi:hypothetical protein